MIEVLSDAGLCTVQDLGRPGYLDLGVGRSGAMDPMALAAGNALLDNPEGAAAIEVQVFPFAVRFTADCAFALTGADGGATLDGAPLLPWWSTMARAGQTLRIGLPRGDVWRGSRVYLCVAGGIDVPSVLGSRATQLRGGFGGFEGRALRRGDMLPVGGGMVACGFGAVPPALDLPLESDGLPALRVIPAAEYPRYTAQSQADFWAAAWRITPQSDRYGFRFSGPALMPAAPIELRSHGIVPGVIQVPHGGQPIVQMRDAQPSGGYPKIATIIEADLWRLGQMPIGSRVRFLPCSWEEALGAGQANAAWLAGLRRLAGLRHFQAGDA